MRQRWISRDNVNVHRVPSCQRYLLKCLWHLQVSIDGETVASAKTANTTVASAKTANTTVANAKTANTTAANAKTVNTTVANAKTANSG